MIISRAYGRTIAAPFAVGLPAGPGMPASIDITITVDDRPLLQPAMTESSRVLARAGGDPPYSTLYETHGAFLYRFHDVVDAEISNDLGHIACRVVPGADVERVPVIVGGSVMAAVLQLSGIPVLHASAVQYAGNAIAFVGETKAGKSTLAAMACLAGARLVTDDALPIEVSDTVSCLRGASRLRLRAGSRISGAAERLVVAVSADGRMLMQPEPAAIDRLPLALLAFPSIESVPAFAVRQLRSSEAGLRLLGAPRVRGWAHDNTAELFGFLMECAERVPAVELQVPYGVSIEPETCSALLRALA